MKNELSLELEYKDYDYSKKSEDSRVEFVTNICEVIGHNSTNLHELVTTFKKYFEDHIFTYIRNVYELISDYLPVMEYSHLINEDADRYTAFDFASKDEFNKVINLLRDTIYVLFLQSSYTGYYAIMKGDTIYSLGTSHNDAYSDFILSNSQFKDINANEIKDYYVGVENDDVYFFIPCDVNVFNNEKYNYIENSVLC